MYFREPSADDEYVLCTIRVDGNGVLSIRPDFNKSRKPYKIETTGLGRGSYLPMNFSKLPRFALSSL